MYGKKWMRVATLALGLVSLNVLAAQDFSALNTAELMQLKPSEMGDEDRNAFRAEMQKRSVSMSAAEQEAARNQMREQNRGQGGGRRMQGGGMGRGR
ncbi:hypothetical protein SKTS_17480 [Sulfurimicrobium lacus]|uniref:DUF1104 domain-containing protein n=1 Tax=Sulfurimicrobium lacus TaxID=2715678 RepID=A0A6F8VD28_9PROT|nr:hypothetical protein [Sulfurimicrobium lacus]BCB26862.1 hypothetical protein SKTS_17480 [Sulfurimicrobium lacus]